MDANGLNVGQNSIIGGYWQGGESKFQKTFPMGAEAVFIDEPEWDEDLKEVETANALSDLNFETAQLSEKIAGQALAVKSFLLTGNRDWLAKSEQLNGEISGRFQNVHSLIGEGNPDLPGLLTELETSWKAWFS